MVIRSFWLTRFMINNLNSLYNQVVIVFMYG